MSDFEKSTERLAEEYFDKFGDEYHVRIVAFKEGRNSCRESMLILARAVEQLRTLYWGANAPEDLYPEQIEANEAIAAIKASGNWPVEK